MSNKIKFVAGMSVPVGSTVHTRGRGSYLVVDPANLRYGSVRPGCTIYGENDNGWMPWKADGHDQYGAGPFSIEFVTLAEQPPIFQVGDTVYCPLHGKGKVFSVDAERIYPVRVNFEDRGEQVYTKGGQFITKAARTLFFSPLTIDATHLNRPRPVFAPGNVVFNERSGVVSVVSHDSTDSDQVTLFQGGAQSGPTFTVSYSQLRLISQTV